MTILALPLGIAACACIWAVLSPSVRDGIVIKAGLILACLGFGSAALHAIGPAPEFSRPALLVAGGVALAAVGYACRVFGEVKA